MKDRHNSLLLIILLLVFAMIFFMALLGLRNEQAIFDLGIGNDIENWLIMFLSVGSIAKIVVALYKN